MENEFAGQWCKDALRRSYATVTPCYQPQNAQCTHQPPYRTPPHDITSPGHTICIAPYRNPHHSPHIMQRTSHYTPCYTPHYTPRPSKLFALLVSRKPMFSEKQTLSQDYCVPMKHLAVLLLTPLATRYPVAASEPSTSQEVSQNISARVHPSLSFPASQVM